MNGFFAPGQGPGAIPLVGDWNGDGDDDIGIYNPADGGFRLDFNESLRWLSPVAGFHVTCFGVDVRMC